MEPSLVRFSPFAADEAPSPAKRGRSPTPELLATVRGLIETTTLPYREIASRTGVSPAAISRHAAARRWLRPEAALREEQLTAEGRRRARRGALAGRILRRAEDLVSIAEMDPAATVPQMARAAHLLKLAESLDSPAFKPRTRRRRRRKASARANQPPAPDHAAT